MDDLEADIRAAMAAPEAPAIASVSDSPAAASPDPAPSPAPAVAEATKGDDRPRDEHGKFVPKTEAPKAEAKPAADPKAPDAPAAAQPQAQQPAANAPTSQPIPAPQNWKGAGKVQWDKLPAEVRKEISEDYTRYADKESRLTRLETAIGAERAQIYAAQYGSVENGLQTVLAGADLANKNPQGFLLWFAQRSGINLAQMVGQHMQPGAQAPAQAPDPVMQRMQQLETMLTNMAQQQQQSALDPLVAEVNRFAADPAHPFWNDVQDDVFALLKAGRVQGSSPSERLQIAYDMAMWSRPDLRTNLIEEQVNQRLAQQSQAAQQAINASVSVSGSPSGAKLPSEEPPQTLEDTVRQAVRAARDSS